MVSTQEYTIGHDGGVLARKDASAVTLSQNQVAPQRATAIAAFTCPDNFDAVNWVGQRDPVRFVPRAKEVFSGDGTQTTFTLTNDLLPVSGEPELAEQPEPAVVAAADGSEASIASIDYATNEVTLDSAPSSSTDNVQFFPIINEGSIKFRGINALGQDIGPVYPWGHPLFRWTDVNQDKRGTEVTLPWPSVTWERAETVEVVMDSPRQIVWEDADYPGAYASSLDIDVEITF